MQLSSIPQQSHVSTASAMDTQPNSVQKTYDLEEKLAYMHGYENNFNVRYCMWYHERS